MSTATAPVAADRVAYGKGARIITPLESHREFTPAHSRDPVALLLEQARSREADLVPIRHGRMLASPFAFFRGAALPMAADLATTPVSGLRVQLCGDAHLANFGAFASPERRLVFDINDFDETLPGPFEWDVKRLAASFAVAGRQNGFTANQCRASALAAVRSYRTAMRQFAQQSALPVWYAHLDLDQAVAGFRSQIPRNRLKAVERMIARARTRDSRHALAKLTATIDGRPRFVSNPPTVVPVEEIFGDLEADAVYRILRTVLDTYRRSLQSDRRHLVEQFELVQAARKIVGVGSVGQRAWVALLLADDGTEPLILQAKEAQPSILGDYCGHGRDRNEGERVVGGQRLMQAASDLFLGWTCHVGTDGSERDFYVRQLRDWKLSLTVDRMRPEGAVVYANLCGWTLARAHARSGDRIAVAAYLGRSDRFDQAVADFADGYAEQNERDHATFQEAVDRGRVTAVSGV